MYRSSMSFSSKVKEEVSKQYSNARHCQIAEIAAIISICGRIHITEMEKYSVRIHTENLAVARKCFTLIRKTFNIDVGISIRQNTLYKKSRTYIIVIRYNNDALRVLQATKLISADQEIKENLSPASNMVIINDCCKRAFIRGAFLAAGSISDPNKFYHFEIVCATEPKSFQLKKILHSFNIDAKIVERKRYFVVYIKEGSQIADALNIMEAHVALMDFENIRILKEMRNSVNRKVNCETANINKTVSAAVKQIEDIKYILDTVGLSELSEVLEEMARVRLDNPEASLKELGKMLSPMVGKSGVNHRLRKICEIADCLKEKEEARNGDKEHDN